MHNYYAPLASQVEELDRHVTFALPPNHTDKNSTNWRQKKKCRIKDQRLSVLDGSIPSAISNTGTAASASNRQTQQLQREYSQQQPLAERLATKPEQQQ
jgi:hypothetical protein